MPDSSPTDEARPATDRRPIAARRRLIATAAGLAAGSLVAPAAHAQTAYPSRPVRVVVGLTPGGAADIAVRAQAGPLEKALGQPVVVENKPGGLFQISMQALMTAPPDGHTLLYIFNSYASIQVTQKLFDLKAQLIPVAQIASTPIMLMVKGDSRHRTLKDLVDFGRANPEKLTYATYGPGSVEHLKVAQFERAADFRATAVAYKGGPDAMKALLGGEIEFSLAPAIFAKQYGPTGQLRALAILEPTRWNDFPHVPTFAELGWKVPSLAYWGGYAVRAGTPPDVVQRLFRELTTTAVLPEVVEKLTAAGGTMMVSRSPQEFSRYLDADIAWMTDAARALNLLPG